MSSEECTIFCRNLAENVTESILYELFLQAGPLEDVRIPTMDGRNRNYGFIVYKHKCSVPYAIDLFQDIKLFGKYITLQNRMLTAKKEESLRSRYGNRNDEINSLRGGPLPNVSRTDDSMSLRGGPISFWRKDNMMPREYTDDTFSLKLNKDHSSDLRFVNPYASVMNSYQSQQNFPSNYNGRYTKDFHDKNNRSDRDNSRHRRRDHDNSRHDWNSSRRDFGRSERDKPRQRQRRSRSRDRSPISRRTGKYRNR